MRRLLPLLVVALLLPSAARADHGEPVYGTDWQLNAAQAYWHVSLTCAHIAWGYGGSDLSAEAEVAGCRIWLYPGWLKKNPVRRCETIVHEFGHLLGYGHTIDLGIMDPLRDDGSVPACRPARKGNSSVHLQRIKRDAYTPLFHAPGTKRWLGR